MDVELVAAAGAMASTGRFEDDAAGRQAAEAALELGDVSCDGTPHRLNAFHSLKFDLKRDFHETPQPMFAAIRMTFSFRCRYRSSGQMFLDLVHRMVGQ